MKSIFHIFWCILLSACFAVNSFAASLPSALQSSVPVPEVQAKSWVLMEAETQWVIAEKDADMRIEPASLTKLMTLYVLFELIEKGQFGLQDKVTISEKARYVEGSRMFAELNSEVTVLNLLKSVIIQSGNDASIALAEFAAGSEEGFVSLMNDTVIRMGLKNSQFKNVSGLPDEGHYSSARDIAIISQALIKNYEAYYPWFSVREMTHNNITQANRNRLLDRANWIDGLKTGYTEIAGYCLAASGKQGETRFIAVVTGSDSDKLRNQATFSLLQYGFANYEYYAPKLDELSRQIRVYGGEQDFVETLPSSQVKIVVPKGESINDYENVSINFRLEKSIEAPVTAGDTVGTVRVSYKDEVIATQAMTSKIDIKEGGFFKRLTDKVKSSF